MQTWRRCTPIYNKRCTHRWQTFSVTAREQACRTSNDNVIISKDGPVTIITMNRNSVRNAIDKPTGERLRKIFEDFEKDDDQFVAVLTGSGGNFCAG
jgi:1,4-dihydroxy-2-naphthoyl-CoA synthase